MSGQEKSMTGLKRSELVACCGVSESATALSSSHALKSDVWSISGVRGPIASSKGLWSARGPMHRCTMLLTRMR